jgi:hypothetical protein
VDTSGLFFVFAYLLYNNVIATQEKLATFVRPASGGAWIPGPVMWDSAVDPPAPPPSFITQLAPMNLVGLASGLYGTVLGFGFSVGSANLLYYLEAALALAAAPAVVISQGGGGRSLAVPRPKTPFPVCAPPPRVIDCFACACGSCGDLPLPGELLEHLGFFVGGA